MQMTPPGHSHAELGLGRAPPLRSNTTPTTGFDSLQELLEREGYKETRIVTPAPKAPVVRSIDDADELPDEGQKPDEYPDIQAWMKGMMASQAQDTAHPDVHYDPPQRRVLKSSKSEIALRSIPRRRSVIWDASRAYRSGVPPMPEPKAAPAIPGAASLSFLASPAAPVVSKEDAVVHCDEEPKAPSRALRRSKSQDLLQKTLRGRSSAKSLRPQPPVCSCGRGAARSALRWRKAPANVEPRYHAHDCPVRLTWEASTDEPVPPAPPTLMVSTPRGVSAPKQLELSGRDYEPGDMQLLFRHLPQPRLDLVKRATIAGLYGLFHAPETISEQHLLGPPSRRRSPRKRAPRTVSVPHLRSLDGLRTPSSPRSPRRRMRSASDRIHALKESVDERIATDAAPHSEKQPYAMLSKFDDATHPMSPDKENQEDDVLMQSPTMQRALSRSHARSIAALGEERPVLGASDAAQRSVLSSNAPAPAPPLPQSLPLAPSALPMAFREPKNAPQLRPKLDVRKPSKTRPAVSHSPPKPNVLGTRTGFSDPSEARTLRRAQSSKVLRPQRKPSMAALGLGLALPSGGAPALFFDNKVHCSYSSASSSEGMPEHRTRQNIPPVPPIPKAYAPR